MQEPDGDVFQGLFGSGEAQHGEWDPMTFVPIIRKNARQPARFVEEFFTAADNQGVIPVAVYQGESSVTRDNTFVGAFMVPLQPSMPAHAPVHIAFEYLCPLSRAVLRPL